ncbi:MAG: hypothetical protein JXR37_32390 [Kiritimatiellae bacterium]|nr:hypothetical protein [Kiritimatiellia bacterium]
MPALLSSWDMIPDGYGPGKDKVAIVWKATTGAVAGHVEVLVSGEGNTGPQKIMLAAAGASPSQGAWDCREWHWWKNCPFDPAEMRPRKTRATGGVDAGPGGIRVWSRYLTDGVEVLQEWFFDDLANADAGRYDALCTFRNTHDTTLEEYGQFFASYTAWNDPVGGGGWRHPNAAGHLYWNGAGQLVNFKTAGGAHLDYYVVEAGSPFHQLGHIPHCPKGGGVVKDVWKYPLSISQPNANGYRHVILCERNGVSALAQGENGVAQDYLLYPPGVDFEPGRTFSVHVRHLIEHLPSEPELPAFLDAAWQQFVAAHTRVHRHTRYPKAPRSK